jgi:hypothetical protein
MTYVKSHSTSNGISRVAIGAARKRHGPENPLHQSRIAPIPQGPLTVKTIWSGVGTFVSWNLSPLKGGKPSAF